MTHTHQPEPEDQAERRERYATAIRDRVRLRLGARVLALAEQGRPLKMSFTEAEVAADAAITIADAELRAAVSVPAPAPTDRAAILREAADRLARVPFTHVLTELRRLAAAASDPSCPGHPDCERCDVTDPCPCCGLTFRNGQWTAAAASGSGRVADETQAEARALRGELTPFQRLGDVEDPLPQTERVLGSRRLGSVMHAIPQPGSNGISACCNRAPCEFIGERVTRDPNEVTCPGPAVASQPDGEQRCPAKHGALGRICELPTGHDGMHTGSGPNGGAVWDGDAS